MKDSSQLINSLKSSESQELVQTQHTHTRTFNDTDKQATIYLFKCIAAIYANKWVATFPNEEVLSDARRMWAADIGKFSREDIDSCVALIKKLKVAGDPNFEWPDIARIISLLNGEYESEFHSWEHTSEAYKKFDRSNALEVLPASKEVQKSALDKLRAMF